MKQHKPSQLEPSKVNRSANKINKVLAKITDPLSATGIFRLQRTIGNQALSRIATKQSEIDPEKLPSRSSEKQSIEVLLIARSVGKRSKAEPLIPEGHAGLVFNLGRQGMNDHWLVQGGPQNGQLTGGVHHCTVGWYQEFSVAQGAIWDTKETLSLPVYILARGFTNRISSRHLIRVSEKINNEHSPYNYTEGPNSNTYIHKFSNLMRISFPTIGGQLKLKGW